MENHDLSRPEGLRQIKETYKTCCLMVNILIFFYTAELELHFQNVALSQSYLIKMNSSKLTHQNVSFIFRLHTFTKWTFINKINSVTFIIRTVIIIIFIFFFKLFIEDIYFMVKNKMLELTPWCEQYPVQ